MLLLIQCYLNFWNIATFTTGLGGSFTPLHLCQPLGVFLCLTNYRSHFRQTFLYCLFAGFILCDEGRGSCSLDCPVSSVASDFKSHVTMVDGCATCSIRGRSSVPGYVSWPWSSQDKILVTLYCCWGVMTCYTLLVNDTDDLLNEAESNFWRE